MAKKTQREEGKIKQDGFLATESLDNAWIEIEFQQGKGPSQRPPLPKVPLLQRGRSSKKGGANPSNYNACKDRFRVFGRRTAKG